MNSLPAIDPALLNRVTALRRDLHRHPQLGYEETYASQAVQRELARVGVDTVRIAATTGVLATLIPTDPKARQRPGVALRADMDALPIGEASGVEHASLTPGLMHACGHDGHTAALLGAAELIAAGRDHLPRPVLLIFQPAEEVGAGAARLIDEHALDAERNGFEIDAVFALHNWPGLPLGSIELLDGPTMAGTNRLVIELSGRGGHAAMPHRAADLPLAAATLVQQLHASIPRRLDPHDAALLTVASIRAGEAHNVLPATATLEGTLRYFNDATRSTLLDQLHRVTRGVAEAAGCEARIDLDNGYPPTVNHRPAVETGRAAADRAGLAVVPEAAPSMAAEDFAFFGQHCPIAYAKLGVETPDRVSASLHHPAYDFNDRALPHAVSWLTQLAFAAA
mgnify:CR=1 FL=1